MISYKWQRHSTLEGIDLRSELQGSVYRPTPHEGCTPRGIRGYVFEAENDVHYYRSAALRLFRRCNYCVIWTHENVMDADRWGGGASHGPRDGAASQASQRLYQVYIVSFVSTSCRDDKVDAVGVIMIRLVGQTVINKIMNHR